MTYIDASAALKLIVLEQGSQECRRLVFDRLTAGDPVVSSSLLVTELHRARQRLGVGRSAVDRVLSQLGLIRVTNSILRAAGELTGVHLRSLDAIHVATAVEADVIQMLTYDTRQAEAAAAAGIRTLFPLDD